MRVLVTGATGALGPATVNEFTTARFALPVLARRADLPLLPSVEVCMGDRTDRASLKRATEGADAVHHAGLLHIVSPPTEMLAEFTRFDAKGAHRAGKPGRFPRLYSSISIELPRRGAP